MTKKKISKASGEAQAEEQAGVSPAQSPDYTVGQWNGREQYLCAHCQFDTLLYEELREHLFWMHSVLLDE